MNHTNWDSHSNCGFAQHIAVRTLILCLALFVFVVAAGCRTKPAPAPQTQIKSAAPAFQSDLGAVPWTHLNFADEPDAFHFAIVADRTGGNRPGIFEDAMSKLNLLQPEFVLSVGDLIEGYTQDPVVYNGMWREFAEKVSRLDMPFFRVAGNHDVSNPAMDVGWDRLFGNRYYWFTYKNVLFVCLNSQDNEKRAGLGATQIAWAKDVIARNPKARWTFVFMHQPLWVYDEGNLQTARKNIKESQDTGFAQIEDALAGRKYTVVAGHFHQYTKFIRRGQSYYILASTGGDSNLAGPKEGMFDHVVWATMQSRGPVLVNLMLDGILRDDVYTEFHARVAQSLKFKTNSVPLDASGMSLKAAFEWTNSFPQAAKITLAWSAQPECAWTVTPWCVEQDVAPSMELSMKFHAALAAPDAAVIPLPMLQASLAVSNGPTIEKTLALPFDMTGYLLARLPEARCRKAAAAIKTDGILDEPEWNTAPDAEKMTAKALDRKPSVPTTFWFCHDADNLYVAARCAETNLAGLVTKATQRDGACWEDDSIELFLITDPKTRGYHQFIATAAGVVYDGKIRDSKWNGEWTWATGREKDAWTLEMTIPWKTMGIAAPAPGTRMGMELVRTRVQGKKEILQWAPAPADNHDTKMFGWLCFEPQTLRRKR